MTIVHKGNIMKFTEGAFRDWAYGAAERIFGDKVYTWAQYERTKKEKGEAAANDEQKAALKAGAVLIKDAIADITLQQVLTRPEDFDVIATLNLNGDYLSATPSPRRLAASASRPAATSITSPATPSSKPRTAPRRNMPTRTGSIPAGGAQRRNDVPLHGLGRSRRPDHQRAERRHRLKRVTYDFARQMEGATEIKCSEFGDNIVSHM